MWTMHSKNLTQACSGLMPYCKVLGLNLNNYAVLNSCTLTKSLGVAPHIGQDWFDFVPVNIFKILPSIS